MSTYNKPDKEPPGPFPTDPPLDKPLKDEPPPPATPPVEQPTPPAGDGDSDA